MYLWGRCGQVYFSYALDTTTRRQRPHKHKRFFIMSQEHIHQTRLRRCGSFFTLNGKQNMYYCADFRNCQRCFRKRVEAEANLIRTYMENCNLQELHIAFFFIKRLADNFTARLRKNNIPYRRYVTDDDVFTIIYDGELKDSEDHETATFADIFEMLPNVMMTSPGSCISGKLGKVASEEQDRGPCEIIKAKAMWSNAPTLLEAEVLQETLEEVAQLEIDPADTKQYEQAWDLVNRLYETNLNLRGYKIISFVYLKRKLYTKEMNFQAEILECLGVSLKQTPAVVFL